MIVIGITELGLLFIGAAWFIQVFDVSRKEVKLNKQFVLLYSLGTAMLVLENIITKTQTTALLNLIALSGSLILFFKLK